MSIKIKFSDQSFRTSSKIVGTTLELELENTNLEYADLEIDKSIDNVKFITSLGQPTNSTFFLPATIYKIAVVVDGKKFFLNTKNFTTDQHNRFIDPSFESSFYTLPNSLSQKYFHSTYLRLDRYIFNRYSPFPNRLSELNPNLIGINSIKYFMKYQIVKQMEIIQEIKDQKKAIQFFNLGNPFPLKLTTHVLLPTIPHYIYYPTKSYKLSVFRNYQWSERPVAHRKVFRELIKLDRFVIHKLPKAKLISLAMGIDWFFGVNFKEGYIQSLKSNESVQLDKEHSIIQYGLEKSQQDHYFYIRNGYFRQWDENSVPEEFKDVKISNLFAVNDKEFIQVFRAR